MSSSLFQLLTIASSIIQKQQRKLNELRTVIESLPGSVYWKDRDGVYLGRNNTAQQQMKKAGFAWEYCEGYTDRDLFAPSIADEFRQNDLKVMREDSQSAHEETIITPEHKVKINYSIKCPLKAQDKIIGVVGISFDISDLRKLEKEFKAFKYEAEQVSIIKKKFIQNIEHDMRTPTSSIAALAEDLLQQPLPAPAHQQIEDIKTCSANLLMYISKIVDYSHSIEHKSKPQRKMFELATLFNAVFPSHKLSAINKNIKFNINIAPNLPKKIVSDYFLIFRILSNLLSNAFKFTDRGSVNITVKYQGGSSPNLIITISDTGLGIKTDDQDYIFDSFFRVQSSNQETYEGSGLGLSIVKKALESLKGDITVKSDIGKGSRFTCRIPIHECSDSLNDEQIESFWKHYKKTHSKVLLIEDNPICQKVAESRLLSENFDIDTVSNGIGAVKKVNRHHYDLILIDIGLPDISGFSVADYIHHESIYNRSTAIIALSSHSEASIHEELIKSPIAATLVKPLSSEKLARILYDLSTKLQEPKET